MPDVVWRTLHPPRTVQPWFVRFEGESRPARAAREKREKDEQEKEKRAEKAKKDAAREKAKKEDRDRKAAKDAEEAAVKQAEREAARIAATRFGMPLLVLASLSSLFAVGLMGAAALWFLVGHLPILRRIGIHPLASNLFEDGLVLAAIVATGVAWLLSLLAATRRAGTSFTGVLPWAGFMVFVSCLPMVGPFFSLFFAWQSFIGAEPTIGAEDKIPRFAAWPLGLVHLFLGFFVHLAYAALTRSAVGLYVG